jgi:phosphoenolpyruvate phosphomutase / 2-hydroxyethylphosphonate cytidylyltransferase
MAKRKTKIVYVGMCADLIHNKHIDTIAEARKLGEVVVGLLTDEAIASYKRVPFLHFDDRKKIIENIVGVKKVIPQLTLDYTQNLRLIKPDYVVHGEDWKTGVQQKTRNKVIKVLREWKGSLIETKYVPGISSTQLINHARGNGVTASHRCGQLRRLLEVKPITRIMEAHNGLTGLIVENTKIVHNGQVREFDGMWESSLTDATSKGKPDISAVDVSSRIHTIEQILEVTTKPIIVDGDSGGLPEHFIFTVKSLERLGVSAVIIEDKIGAKRNSLFGTESQTPQVQDDIDNFAKKINAGKKAQVTSDFMIIARIESLILKKGIDDALERAKAFIGAGADGIMIHSKDPDPTEIFKFCELYQKIKHKVPLVAVPTAYNQITEKKLEKRGVKIVIYANHLIRSAYPAMVKTAKLILKNGRSREADRLCLPIKEVISLIPPINIE